MRIERTGKVEALTPRVERFLAEVLACVSLDTPGSSEQTRPDYTCLAGKLVIEIKTLEDSGESRIDNLMSELQTREDWPIFLGSAPLEAFLSQLEEPEVLRRKFINRIGRSTATHLKKANKQLQSYQGSEFDLQNRLNLVIIINEDHSTYEPRTVAYVTKHQLYRRDNGQSQLNSIDSVLYFSERHATIVDGLITFPTVCIEGPNIAHKQWAREMLDRISREWARWNNARMYESGDPSTDIDKFQSIESIPDKMPRHEQWALEYRRNPYMQALKKAELRQRFDDAMLVNVLAFLKDSPEKPPRAAIAINMELLSHLMVEMGERGIPATDFAHSGNRLAKAARRLGMSKRVQRWAKAL